MKTIIISFFKTLENIFVFVSKSIMIFLKKLFYLVLDPFVSAIIFFNNLIMFW